MAGPASPTDLVLAQLQALGVDARAQEWSQPTLSPFALSNMGGKLAAKPVVPEALQGLFNALALPGETLAGKYEGMDPGAQTSAMLQDALGASLDMGMPAAAGGAGLAAKQGVDPELLNIFIGPKGARNLGTLPAFETADRAFAKLDYKPSPKDVQSIFEDTNVFPGAEGRLRQEIPDVEVVGKYIPHVGKEFEQNQKLFGKFAPPLEHMRREGYGTLSNFLNHSALFEAYPELASLGTEVKARMGPPGGYYDHGLKFIGAEGFAPEDIASVLLHEAQHAIQRQEGFPTGGNPNMTGTVISSMEPRADKQLELASPHALYEALMGETEARNVQWRYEEGTMAVPEFRWMANPTLTEDVPRPFQIQPEQLWAPNPTEYPQEHERMLSYLRALGDWERGRKK